MARSKRGAGEAAARPKAGVTTWIKRILFSGLVVVLLATLAGLIGVAGLYLTVTLPDPNKDFQTNTTVIYYRDGQTTMGDLSVQNRESISYTEMP